MRCQRLDATRQRRIGGVGGGERPAHRRGRIDGSVEIVAESSSQRLFETLGDGDAVDDRRPEILRRAGDELGDGPRLGLEPLHALVRVRKRRAGSFELLACRKVAGFGSLCRGFGLGDAALSTVHRGCQRCEIAKAFGLLRELLLLGLDIRDVLVEPGQTVAVTAHVLFELIAPGGEVGKRRGELAEQPLGIGQRRLGRGHPRVNPGALFDARLDLFLELEVFGVEPCERDIRIRHLLPLAGHVGRKLRQAPIELGDALLGALLLAIEQLARIGKPLQAGGGTRLRLAHRGQLGGAVGLDAGGLGLLAGAFSLLAHGEIVRMRRFRHLGIGFHPAQMEQHGLGLAHPGGDLAIADRLTRLLFQAVDLAGELADHVLDAGEIGLGGLQPQLGFMAAGVQACDARGILQHAAALLGLGLDDLADLALVHQRRRARAGRGIRKQDLDIARAHVSAVDAVHRTCLALDAARDFQDLAVVHRRRRSAIGVVDRHDDFGMVARRTVAGTGEDHGIHVGGAQRLVRGLPHRPAQRLDQVGFAAAVRTDDAG